MLLPGQIGRFVLIEYILTVEHDQIWLCFLMRINLHQIKIGCILTLFNRTHCFYRNLKKKTKSHKAIVLTLSSHLIPPNLPVLLQNKCLSSAYNNPFNWVRQLPKLRIGNSYHKFWQFLLLFTLRSILSLSDSFISSIQHLLTRLNSSFWLRLRVIIESNILAHTTDFVLSRDSSQRRWLY